MYLTVSLGGNDWVSNKISFQHSFPSLHPPKKSFTFVCRDHMLFHLNCPKSQFVLAAFCKNAIMVNFSKSDPSTTRSSLWIIPTPLRLHFRFCFVGREWTKGWVINKRNGKPDSLEWCVLSGGLKGKGSSFPAAGSSSGRDVVGKYSWGESEKRNLAEKLSARFLWFSGSVQLRLFLQPAKQPIAIGRGARGEVRLSG